MIAPPIIRVFSRIVGIYLMIQFLLLFTVSVYGAEAQITDSRATRRCQVTIIAAPFTPRKDALGHYGTDGSVPSTTIQWLTVRIGKQSYQFPPGLYEDLADPCIGSSFIKQTFTASETWRDVTVVLSGGDGAGSYDCRWRISKARLEVSRSVRAHPSAGYPPFDAPQKLIPISILKPLPALSRN